MSWGAFARPLTLEDVSRIKLPRMNDIDRADDRAKRLTWNTVRAADPANRRTWKLTDEQRHELYMAMRDVTDGFTLPTPRGFLTALAHRYKVTPNAVREAINRRRERLELLEKHG